MRVTAVLWDPTERRLLGDSSGQTVALVDESGTYRLSDLAPGVWNVTALTGSGRHASGQVTLAPGAQEAELDLDFENSGD